MTPSLPKVAIILVNYNGYADTIECLRSLTTTQCGASKVFVVDNGSTDGSMAEIAQWLRDSETDTAELIALQANMGFGVANNVGMERAFADDYNYALLLNNDTVVTEGFLAKMLGTFEHFNDAGIVGGLIRNYYRQGDVWFSGGYIDYIRGAFYHLHNTCKGMRQSGFITGCLMLIPQRVYRETGGFDDRYFLNVEDIDLCCRVRDAGYRLVVNCDAVIYHKISASIGGLYSRRHQYYFHRNRMLFFGNRLRGMRKGVFYALQFLVAIPIWMAIQLLKGNLNAVKGALKGYYDLLRGHTGKG
ncbi:MAG: glycosyltransferase family 2 protein [Nitrospirae bacterium]|uniref:glycosyltransferase family 2 protein n=1 Tax=Candidatus Magnetobacterium casense TaxID=1455061 RepID=UPI00058CB044|nr:glycosyltransferase family 2 protein [Candidatus Magnetobacterium casensis]MBF0337132.1 glycosyltransferase family 2 protein [Nitrospirota bacterium]